MLCHSPQCYLCLLRLAPALLLLFGLELFVQSHFLVLCCDLNTITRLDKNSREVFWISICINRKQFINATKSKKKINILQRLCTTRSATISMTQMVYDSELRDNDFIREALNTVGNLNKIALDNYCSTLMKVRTQQTEIRSNGAPSDPRG